jgi:hypothetical protein
MFFHAAAVPYQRKLTINMMCSAPSRKRVELGLKIEFEQIFLNAYRHGPFKALRRSSG